MTVLVLLLIVFGCTDTGACNFDAVANTDDASCLLPSGCESCDGNGGLDANDDDGDGVCNADEIAGCMNSAACNYDAMTTDDDGSCIYSTDLDACATCSGEQDGTGTIVDDADDDGL